MCFNFEASVITFIVGSLISIYNLYTFRGNINYTLLNIFWFGAILMQLWESFIWKNVSCKIFSKAAMITNILQPVVLLLAIPQLVKEKGKYIIYNTIYLFCIFLLHYKELCNSKNLYKKNDGIYLNWWHKDVNGQKNYGGYIYVITILLLFSIIYKKYILASQSFYFLITLFISFFIYNKKNVGSLWCFFAAFAPVFNHIVFKSLGN